MIVAKYAIEIVVDDDAWQQNYGESDSLFAVSDDIRKTMASVVTELVDDWIAKSGNRGAVRKIVTK